MKKLLLIILMIGNIISCKEDSNTELPKPTPEPKKVDNGFNMPAINLNVENVKAYLLKEKATIVLDEKIGDTLTITAMLKAGENKLFNGVTYTYIYKGTEISCMNVNLSYVNDISNDIFKQQEVQQYIDKLK